MVIIITGASHAGKTVLVQKMLEKYKYPYLSVNHLKMGLIRSGNTNLTPEDDSQLVDYLWPIVRFVCLAFSDGYIDAHFAEIKAHGSDIEKRLDDSYCTVEQLKKDNRQMIEGFRAAGERVFLIDDDYEKRSQELLNE